MVGSGRVAMEKTSEAEVKTLLPKDDASERPTNNKSKTEGKRKWKEDLLMLVVVVGICLDSNQFHGTAKETREHGGFWFLGLVFVVEVFIALPVLGVMLHCANHTKAGITKFPQLYGRIFGFIGIGMIAVVLLQQSVAIANAAEAMAWGTHFKNGTYNLVHCSQDLNMDPTEEVHTCTSIADFKPCFEENTGRSWMQMMNSGICSWLPRDPMSRPAPEIYKEKWFPEDEVWPTNYVIAAMVTCFSLLFFSAALPFIGFRLMTAIIAGIVVLSFILTTVICLYIIYLGNVHTGALTVSNLSQLQKLANPHTLSSLSKAVLDGMILKFPVATLFSFRSRSINPFQVALGIISCDLFLKIVFSFVNLAITGFYADYAYISSYVDIKSKFFALPMSEMFGIDGHDNWLLLYHITIAIVDIPSIALPFYLCLGLVRDHFPQKKWLCISLSVVGIILFQTGMCVYYVYTTNQAVISGIYGFYGLFLVAGLMLASVVIYGEMEMLLDVDKMADEWRLRTIWRKVFIPYSFWMITNLLIPILCFMAMLRVTFAANLMRKSVSYRVDIAITCVPAAAMLIKLIYDLIHLRVNKKLNLRVFLPGVAHPSYDRVLDKKYKTYKSQKEEKEKRDKEAEEERQRKAWSQKPSAEQLQKEGERTQQSKEQIQATQNTGDSVPRSVDEGEKPASRDSKPGSLEQTPGPSKPGSRPSPGLTPEAATLEAATEGPINP